MCDAQNQYVVHSCSPGLAPFYPSNWGAPLRLGGLCKNSAKQRHLPLVLRCKHRANAIMDFSAHALWDIPSCYQTLPDRSVLEGNCTARDQRSRVVEGGRLALPPLHPGPPRWPILRWPRHGTCRLCQRGLPHGQLRLQQCRYRTRTKCALSCEHASITSGVS